MESVCRLFCLTLVVLTLTAEDRRPLRLAILGDSISVGIPQQTIPEPGTTLNWVATLALAGLVDVGPWQAQSKEGDDIRASHYARVWAAWGATCASVVRSGWVEDLCRQADSIDRVIVFLGHNELWPLVRRDLPLGRIPEAEAVDQLLAEHRQGLDAILQALTESFGNRVTVVLPLDWAVSDLVRRVPQREHVARELTRLNGELAHQTRALALAKGLAVCDLGPHVARIATRPAPLFCGLPINPAGCGGGLTDLFLRDGVHITTLVSAVIGREVLAASTGQEADAILPDEVAWELTGAHPEIIADIQRRWREAETSGQPYAHVTVIMDHHDQDGHDHDEPDH